MARTKNHKPTPTTRATFSRILRFSRCTSTFFTRQLVTLTKSKSRRISQGTKSSNSNKKKRIKEKRCKRMIRAQRKMMRRRMILSARVRFVLRAETRLVKERSAKSS